MGLRIAFDMDGVLADMHGEAARHPDTRRFWKHVDDTENFWETLAEIEPGAVAGIAAAAARHGWEVLFITRRPPSAGATAQVQTQRWLQSKGFTLPSVYVVQGSRGRIAAALALDVVVDDRLENCLDVVAESQAKAVLISRQSRQLPPDVAGQMRVSVVSSVQECLRHLTSGERAGRGILGRLKDLFTGR